MKRKCGNEVTYPKNTNNGGILQRYLKRIQFSFVNEKSR